METKEVKIGGTATFRGISLRAEAATRNKEDGRALCDGCYFFDRGMGCPDGFACMADCREDRTDVIFREVKEERP